MIPTVSTKPPSGGPRSASGNHVAWPKPQHLGPLRPGLEDGKGPCLEQSPHLRLQRGRCSFGLTSKRDHEILVSSSRRCLRSTPDLFLPRPQHRAGVTLGSHCQFWLHQAFTPTLTRGIHCGLVYSLQHGTQGRAQGPSARGDRVSASGNLETTLRSSCSPQVRTTLRCSHEPPGLPYVCLCPVTLCVTMTYWVPLCLCPHGPLSASP